jgi:hypothetical protein
VVAALALLVHRVNGGGFNASDLAEVTAGGLTFLDLLALAKAVEGLGKKLRGW